MANLSARKEKEIETLQANMKKRIVDRKTSNKVVVKKIRDLGELNLMSAEDIIV